MEVFFFNKLRPRTFDLCRMSKTRISSLERNPDSAGICVQEFIFRFGTFLKGGLGVWHRLARLGFDFSETKCLSIDCSRVARHKPVNRHCHCFLCERLYPEGLTGKTWLLVLRGSWAFGAGVHGSIALLGIWLLPDLIFWWMSDEWDLGLS